MVGIGTSVLGYSDKDIIRAGYNSLKSSTMNTLNPPEDVELAEILMKIHPWAQNVILSNRWRKHVDCNKISKSL